MAIKVFVNHPGSLSDEGVKSKQKEVADHLGICCEDVVIMPGMTLSVVEIPDSMCAAREKADKAAEKAEHERLAAEEKAAKEAEKAAEKDAHAHAHKAK